MFRQIKQSEYKQMKDMKRKSYKERTKLEFDSNICLQIQQYTLKQIRDYLMLQSTGKDLHKQQSKSINNRLNQLCFEMESAMNKEVIHKLNKIWNHPENPIKDLEKLNNYCYDKFQFTYQKIQRQVHLKKMWYGHRRYSKPTREESENIKIKYNGEELDQVLHPKKLRRLRLTYQKPLKQQFLEYIEYLQNTHDLYVKSLNME